jgi:hypothetical protein
MATLYGYQVITIPFLTVDGEPYEVIRTWKERLFTFQWRPFHKTNTITPQVPSRTTYVCKENNTIIMHPIIWEEIKNSPAFEGAWKDETYFETRYFYGIHPKADYNSCITFTGV